MKWKTFKEKRPISGVECFIVHNGDVMIARYYSNGKVIADELSRKRGWVTDASVACYKNRISKSPFIPAYADDTWEYASIIVDELSKEDKE